MATGVSVTVLEQCLVAPPRGTTVTEISLPLTFLDMIFIYFSPIQRLVFYELPLSRSDFVDSFIPKLKSSLSSTLRDFLPLAGNLIISSDSIKPEIRYTDGDGVSIIFTESCTGNFNHLTANYARNSCEFYPLVPQLPPPSPSNKTSSMVVPVLALQVTLFPNAAISLAITNHHAVGDASSIFRFMKAWSFQSKLGEDEASLGIESQPFYDRSVIKDLKGIGSMFWNQLRSSNLDSRGGNLHTLPTDTIKIRQTFVLGLKDIQKLKNLVYTKRPTVKHLSSFTVTCAYVWTCLVKSRGAYGEVADEEEGELFVCTADSRGRLDPPIPANYFGNCLTVCFVPAKNAEIVGDEGFPAAAEMIGEILHKKLKNKDEILKDAETWITTTLNMNWERACSVAGSPRYNYYDLDFGWGKPRKFECTSIDQTGAMSLSGCKDSEAGLEIGLSYSKQKIDAFASIFNEGLKAL